MAKSENGKLFGKIHIMDILFILMAVAIVVVVVIKMMIPKEETVISTSELLGSKSVIRAEMTMLTDPYEEEALLNIKVDDQLVELKEYIDGHIVKVEIVDYMITKVDNNGDLVTEAHPFLKQALVTAEASLSYKEPTYKLGTIAVTENKEFFMNTDRVRLKTNIISIEEITE